MLYQYFSHKSYISWSDTYSFATDLLSKSQLMENESVSSCERLQSSWEGGGGGGNNCLHLPVMCMTFSIFLRKGHNDLNKTWPSWNRVSWYNYENNKQDALYRLIYYSKSALHVSGDIFAHHQEHLTIFTVSGSVHPSCCRLAAGSNLCEQIL
jgi:hypothetical protein